MEEQQLDDHYLCTDIDRMENIARQVPLSAMERPAWDTKVLESLGVCSIQTDSEIWKRVWSEEERLNYASTPMFLVRAEKSAEQSFQLGDVTVRSGEKYQGDISFANGDIVLPGTIICGKLPGKTMLITGGVHSGEYVGIQACVELGAELQPEKTVLIETRTTRFSCWPECSTPEEIAAELRRERELQKEIEAEIRRTEPHLLDTGVLFPEIEYWDYEETVNPAYKECLGRIRNYETALYQGSRFERLRRANVANELYLAVPEGLLKPEEVAQGWGLLYVSRKLKISVVKQADRVECPQENMLHLSQNIAASSLNDVLFAHGIGIASNGNVQFRRPPHRRGFRKLNDK